MKLIVQIPCLNEAEDIAEVIRAVPRRIDGVDAVEVLVIDDGSVDGTAAVAAEAGADHVVINKKTLGLARTFQIGITTALSLGADIIVNTDGDGQYAGHSIPDLVAPVVARQADIVVGDRKPGKNLDFSASKRTLQRVGSTVVKRLASIDIPDAVSGFRAYSRDAAMRTTVFTKFSYTTETLIAAGNSGMVVASVPVDTNSVDRPSRLFTSVKSFVFRQMVTILRSFVMYRPLRAFMLLGISLLLVGLLPIIRFLFFYFTDGGQGHVQSLIIGGALIVCGYITCLVALLGDVVATNRRLEEEIIAILRHMEHDGRRRD
ncbi:MAG: glycosyltransferase family 2 protein [Rhodobacteraceae bacterium]|nr:MAG: glycosyltransferase family 2 protein [Paracoccaceae bacterium]